MFKSKGFTLVELLAVIVIVAIVLTIAIPNVSNYINRSKTSAYDFQLDAIERAASIYVVEYGKSRISTVTLGQLIDESLIDANILNPVTNKPFNRNMTINIRKIRNVTEYEVYEGPTLATGMIPVYYDETSGVWKKADKTNTDNNWFDYNKQKWANAVTVTSSTRSTYQNATVGTAILEADILTYLVWVPRYRYRIPSGTGPREIKIMFETKDTTKSTGDAVNTYYTHPAFTFGDTELDGIWVGKFETTGTISAMTIKPNLQSLRSQTVSSFYTAIRNMKANGNAYSFDNNEVDTHMMLNSEWGAVAYLSMSTYGLKSEIYKNNSSGYYTGRSGGNVGGSQIKVNGTNEYADAGFYTYDGKCATTTTAAPGINANCTTIGNTVSDTSLSYKASTTGTIYGVYDMSGGAAEFMMGNYSNYSGSSLSTNSGFNGSNGDSTAVTGGTPFPENKYYNLYTTSTAATTCNGGICYGHALSETSGWYGDVAGMTNANEPWFIRGGNWGNTSPGGVFYFYGANGAISSTIGARVVVALIN